MNIRNSARVRTNGERQALNHVEEALAARFPGVPRAAVTQHVNEAHARFARARIRDFVPVFVEREVRRQLAAQAD